MKFIVNLLLLTLLIGVGALFILKNPDGTPWISLDNADTGMTVAGIRESLQQVFVSLQGKADAGEANASTAAGSAKQLYRWQDDSGTWHYTDSPLPGVQAEVLVLEAPTILTLNPGLADQDANSEPGDPVDEAPQSGDTDAGLIPQQLQEIRDTVQQARDARDQFQQALDAGEQALDEL